MKKYNVKNTAVLLQDNLDDSKNSIYFQRNAFGIPWLWNHAQVNYWHCKCLCRFIDK